MDSAIAVLEDDERRTDAMRQTLLNRFPGHEAVFFDNAPDMVAWLQEGMRGVSLICLDHDLGPNRQKQGTVFDPGTGRDVVDFLVTRPPSCGVIIHSSNPIGALGMKYVLEKARWDVERVVPFNDLDWIVDTWIACVTQSLEYRGIGVREVPPPAETTTIRFVRPNLAVSGFADIGPRDRFVRHGFACQLQLVANYDSWLSDVLEVKCLPFLDGVPVPPDIFHSALEWLRERWHLGRRILISCAAGESRSVTLAIALVAVEEDSPFFVVAREVMTSLPRAYPDPITLISAAQLSGSVIPPLEELEALYTDARAHIPSPYCRRALEEAVTGCIRSRTGC